MTDIQLSRRSLLSLALLPVVGACSLREEYPPYTYRLTIEVETPEGLRSGSGVMSVRGYISKLDPDGILHTQMLGQGAMVDLGERGRLFSLITQAGGGGWAPPFDVRKRYPQHRKSADMTPEIWRLISTFREPVLVPRRRKMLKNWVDSYPRLVTFVEEGGKQMPKLVDPDNMAASLGEGVRIRRIFAQITDDPAVVTRDSDMPPLPDPIYYQRSPPVVSYTRWQEARLIGGDFYRKEWL